MNIPVTLDVAALKALIKESVREVLQEERFGLRQSVTHEVSAARQADINRVSDLPADRPEDMKKLDRTPDSDYLSAVSSTMTEWASEADELAYHDL